MSPELIESVKKELAEREAKDTALWDKYQADSKQITEQIDALTAQKNEMQKAWHANYLAIDALKSLLTNP